jgi:hypothetical protein
MAVPSPINPLPYFSPQRKLVPPFNHRNGVPHQPSGRVTSNKVIHNRNLSLVYFSAP